MQHIIWERWGREWRVRQRYGQRAKGSHHQHQHHKVKVFFSESCLFLGSRFTIPVTVWGCRTFKSGFRGRFDGGSFSSSKWVRRLDFSVHLPEALICRAFCVWGNLQESQEAAWQGSLWLGYFITYYYLCFCWPVSVYFLLLFCLNYCIFGCLRF